MKVAALFVQRDGVYFGIPEIDPWDESRDARTYSDPWPVVAHPPCSTWGKMAPVNQKRYGHPIGSDGGCFASALATLKRAGGVLEHPEGSLAWKHFDIPKPSRGRWTSFMHEGVQMWGTEVSQSAYGHKARKRTWLLFVSVGGARPLDLDWSEPEATHWCGNDDKHYPPGHPKRKPSLQKKEASRTPEAFRDVLIRLAERSHASAFVYDAQSRWVLRN